MRESDDADPSPTASCLGNSHCLVPAGDAGPARHEGAPHLALRPMAQGPTTTVSLRLGVDGDTLLAALTDGGSLMLVGELPGLYQRLQAAADFWAGGIAPANHEGNTPPQWLQAFGALLFCTLLPARLQAYFSQAPSCHLQLTLAPQLAAVPWEAAFDGHAHWQHFHRVVRHQPDGPGWHGHVRSAKPTTVQVVTVGPQTPEIAAYQLALADCLALHPELLLLDSSAASHGTHAAIALGQAAIVHMVCSRPEDLLAVGAGQPVWSGLQTVDKVLVDCVGSSAPPIGWSTAAQLLPGPLGGRAAVTLIMRPPGSIAGVLPVRRYYEALGGAKTGDSTPGFVHLDSSVTVTYGATGMPREASQPDGASGGRSYRQVTALSYDLVGSTQMMRRLGMERYSLSLHNSHQRFAAVVERWGGLSGQAQGNDGVMCYFGAHHVREDTVRAALKAALELLEVARHMQVEIRVGLATGQVAMNAEHLVGLSIHLAARIRSLAPAGTVLACASTAELASPYFKLAPHLVNQALKGFSTATTVFRIGDAHLSGPADPIAPNHPLRLFGRQDEMDQLRADWARTGAGGARWLRLIGEVGIGKSRLVNCFVQGIRHSGAGHALVCRCYAETSGRAFGPIIDLIERWLNISSTDKQSTRQAKLAKAVIDHAITASDRLAIRYLVGLPTQEGGNPQWPENREPRRRVVMRSMSSWLRKLAQRERVCVVLEDVQWADPSTLEFLQHFKSDAADGAILVIMTGRTGQAAQELQTVADRVMLLERMPDAAVDDLVTALAENQPLTRELRQLIITKSDGVPLFAEMCTRVVLENQAAAGSAYSPDLTGAFPLPLTLRALLLQRLDNLGPARLLAQLCSVIGREFPRNMLLSLCDAQVSAMTVDQANMQIGALLRSGLLVTRQHADSSNAQYHFRHALVQEAAYQSLWETDRRNLHRAIAQTIEERMPEVAATQPELLARHYQACGAPALAAKWHWTAGRQYKTAQAHAESLAQLAAALSCLQKTPVTAQRLHAELEIALAMAVQLIATKGYGSEASLRHYQSALALAQQLGDQKALLRAQLGLQAYHLMRGDFVQAHGQLAQARQTAQGLDDALTRAQCVFALACLQHHQGDAPSMLQNCDACLDYCRQSGVRGKLAHSPEVMGLMYSAIALWETGYADLACRRAQKGVDLAHRLGQRLGIGQALGMQAMVMLWCGEFATALHLCNQAITVCEAGEYAMWTAHARLVKGSCIAELGDAQGACALMEDAYASWTSTGTMLGRSYYLALRAPVSAALGRIDEGLSLIDEAGRIIEQHGERYYEPEVFRIRGDLLHLKAIDSAEHLQTDADAALAKARDSAYTLGYHALGLRVATSMAQQRQRQGRRNDAAAVLQQALAQLDEGYSTRDQRVARALLASVSG